MLNGLINLVKRMQADSLTNYGHWDLKHPVILPRSRLYSLQPIGLGTPHVESLTGYIARLAEAHCIPPGTLIAHEFTDLVKQSGGHSYLHQVNSCTEVLNGTGQMAEAVVQVLEQLTLRDDLRYTTLTAWREIVPVKGLLHHSRAWCSICYEEWKANGQIIYEPLIWNIQAVTICPQHRQQLSFQCPHCNRHLPVLGWHSRPGYCSKCQQWLGKDSDSLIQTDPSSESRWQLWVTNNVEKLLAHSLHIQEIQTKGRVAKALSIAISSMTEGNIAEFARRLEMRKNAVWQWQSGAVLPQLKTLLQICHALELPLLEFLFKPQILDSTNRLVSVSRINSPNIQRCKDRTDIEQVQQYLQDVLSEDPPPTMRIVARRLNYDSRSLRRKFPAFCTAISTRYLNHRKQVRMVKVEQSCQEVRRIAIHLYSKGIDPTRSHIAKYLSKPAYFREPLVVAFLETVRRELNLEE